MAGASPARRGSDLTALARGPGPRTTARRLRSGPPDGEGTHRTGSSRTGPMAQSATRSRSTCTAQRRSRHVRTSGHIPGCVWFTRAVRSRPGAPRRAGRGTRRRRPGGYAQSRNGGAQPPMRETGHDLYRGRVPGLQRGRLTGLALKGEDLAPAQSRVRPQKPYLNRSWNVWIERSSWPVTFRRGTRLKPGASARLWSPRGE